MKIKFAASSLVIFSIWISLLAPFIAAQIPLYPISTQTNGLQFRISEAARIEKEKKTPKPAKIDKLSQTEADAIFRRLPPIHVETDDTADFRMRSDSLKPPRTGNIIPIKFPADETRTNPNSPNSIAKNLEVERFSPIGNVPLTTEMSITFSQPMIAVTSQTEAEKDVPVRLSPAVIGKWRWLGTNTLIFDAETRFPAATKFTATVPQGTASQVGGILAKDFSFTFTTPPPKIEAFAPKEKDADVFPEYALMTAKFDQEIDEKAILPKISVFADGKRMPVKLITDETDGSYIVVQQLGEIQPKHWLAFRTIERLPLNAEIKVVFEKGLPSAEGELTTEGEQIFSFKTLEPLKFVKSFCGNYDNKTDCAPSDDLRIRFNHSLYPAPFEPGNVTVEPLIENVKIIPQGNQIYIQGKKKPNTTYRVKVLGAIKDFYKLPLGSDFSTVFEVGIEHPKFFAQGGDFVTLDPQAKPTFSVYSQNQASLKIKLYAVAPEDFSKYQQLLRDFYNNQMLAPTPDFGRLIFDKTIETNAEPDALTETRVDLSEALTGNLGHAILIAEPTVKSKDYDYENRPLMTWMQSTNIGIDAIIDYENLTALTTDLKTAKPLGNAEISVYNKQVRAFNSMTDETGTVNVELPAESGEFLLVKNGNDTAILPPRDYYYGLFGNQADRKQYDVSRWFVFDDRKMYRPNEEVSIKGYLRKVTGGKFTDIAELGKNTKSVNYILRDPRNNEIARGTAQLNAFGAFDFNIKLPENINLGYQRLEFWTSGFSGYPEFQHNFQVQEFRRPEFEVAVEAETPAPFFVGTSAVVSAEAKYYTGGFLSDTAVNWTVSAYQTTYSPPNHEDFTFGTFVPWWRNFSENSRIYYSVPAQYFGGTTDAGGKHRINLDFTAANPARPYRLRATAELQDVNRQAVADTKTFLVHPSDVYVGLRSSKTFVRQNEPLAVEAIATDLDGKFVSGAPIKIDAVLKDWQKSGSSWQLVTVDTQTCELISANEKVSCNFTAKQGGVFTFSATVLDSRERPNSSDITIWVAGGNTAPKRGVEQESVELIPDKKEYAPGETAEVLVNAPFFPAEAILTLERNGIIKTERLTISESSTVLRIPIEERFLPNIHVQVDLTGVADRTNDTGEIDKTLPNRPAFAGGELNLNISKESRKLNVAVAPVEKTLAPGEQTNINIEVKDNLGNSVANSEIAVVAVDESVLALSDYKIQNPLDAFYQQIAANVAHYHSREKVLLGNPSALSAKQIENLPVAGRNFSSLLLDGASDDLSGSKKSIIRSEADKNYKNWINKDVAYIISEPEKAEINVRRNFDALAIFAPSVVTDANGKASVKLKLPDNLTRYRITAVAVTKSKQFGLGESNITAKQLLQVRPSAPRFMNFGDRAELPVVLQNQTDKPLTINVAIRASNALLTDGNGKKVTVAANDRAEIRFPVASEKAGTARFQIGATSGKFADAAEIEFPVYTPATSEAFATYGTTEENGAIIQTISAPKEVFADFGGLEVTTSSTQLQELTDAFIYLQTYPYGCSEQVSSRVLSVAAVRDVLTAFEAKDLPSKEKIEAGMKADITRLQQLQHYDGGFSFWRSDDESFPFVSVHVAHAIARARAKGYAVPDEMIAKSLSYLKNIESKLPETYSEESRRAIAAYALYVRDLLGDKDAAKAKKLLEDAGLEKLSAESLGWLLSVLTDDKNSAAEAAAIKQNLLNRITETAGNAHFVTNYTDGEYVLLSSARRADAIILEAFLKSESSADGQTSANPQSAIQNPKSNSLIPKIVRGLLAARIKGRWQSTQENAFVLLALDKYFHAYEKTTPNFVAKIWLGNVFAGEQKFAGRSADSNLIKVPMNYLQTQNARQDLILDRQGEGRLYYRIGLKYAPKNLKLAATDEGFVVSRQYEAIDNADDVKQNADGSWTIKAGARVRVNVQMVAPTRRYHVALVDNLPAGIEIINPRLATSGNNYINFTYDQRKRSFWFEHQNFRDNRAEAFTTLLTEGVWNYSYLARATTPGNFVVPPAKAEEMYAPETFGRSKTDFVRIE